ncbi:MAG TPA: peptide ABC transporter substrate-binding protein [Anaerolineae bacterium]|nr:peptide ABC transporter substrate-binding protein [Anaerolineae bacterium]
MSRRPSFFMLISGRRPLFLAGLMLLVLGCNSVGQLLPEGSESRSNGARAMNLVADYDVDEDQALYLSGGQPRTLDPALSHSGAGGLLGAIFSGLVTLNTELQVEPELAAGWDVSDDGTVYTFYLRPEATFHDGRPITAEDVIYSWERAAAPEMASDTVQTYLGDVVGVADVLAGRAEHVSGLRAIDDHTLEVRIDAPKTYFLSKLTYPVSYVVDRQNVSQPDWQRRPNGSGPFTLQAWEDDEIMILARNEDHYRTPAVSNVVYLMGAGIPMSMYELDEIDLVGVGGGSLERVQDPNSPYFPELRVGADMCTTYVGFDNSRPPFDDPLVRQAFSLAIDRERITDGLYNGNALPAAGLLPPGMPGYSGEVGNLAHEPSAAQALLAQAGYDDPADFPAVTFNTSGYGGVGPLVTALITMWQENLDVTVEPLMLDPYEYLDELYGGNTGHIFNAGWCADYPDPENFLDVLFHSGSQQNLTGYGDPAVDALLEQARVESDVAKRLTLYGDIERQIVAAAPAAFLVHSLSAVLVKPHLKNYVLTPIGVPQWQNVAIER